jgi:hypothetical protein
VGNRRPWSLCTRLSWKRSGRTLDLAAVMRTHGHRGRSSMLVQLGEGEGNLGKWKCSESVIDDHLHVN